MALSLRRGRCRRRAPHPRRCRHREPSTDASETCIDEACLVRVQLKRELAHPLPEVVEKLVRMPAFRLPLAANDEVIGVTNDDSVPRSLSGAPLLLEPEVEDIVQVNVGEDGRNHRALRGPLQVVLPLVVFHDAGVQPLGNQPEYPCVPDSVLEKPQQVVSRGSRSKNARMSASIIQLTLRRSREPVEERPNVRIDYPVDLAPFYPESQGVKRIMRPAPRPEPIAEPEKFRLVKRRQDDIHYRLLDNLVFQGGNAERSRPAVRFGYFNPPRRQRPIRSRVYASVQVEQPLFQSVLVPRPHQTVHASRCGLLQVVEGAP